jgi:hypothetical protein
LAQPPRRLSPSRFSGRTVPEIGAMGGITAYDFSSSVAYREIFGLGLQEGLQEGRQTEAVAPHPPLA